MLKKILERDFEDIKQATVLAYAGLWIFLAFQLYSIISKYLSSDLATFICFWWFVPVIYTSGIPIHILSKLVGPLWCKRQGHTISPYSSPEEKWCSVCCRNTSEKGGGAMPRTDFLKPLNDIAYLCECAAQDYTGELKTELSDLCRLIREKAPGYVAEEIQAALPRLERALESYRARENGQGAMILAGVSRDWWAVVKP